VIRLSFVLRVLALLGSSGDARIRQGRAMGQPSEILARMEPQASATSMSTLPTAPASTAACASAVPSRG
jgi:hypothetical protein